MSNTKTQDFNAETGPVRLRKCDRLGQILPEVKVCAHVRISDLARSDNRSGFARLGM